MKNKIISITSGDIDGIGLEVTMKALQKIRNSNSKYLIFREKKIQNICWKPLPKKITLTTSSLQDAISEASHSRSPYKYFEILSHDSPALWVRDSAQLSINNVISGMVTGPVSKKTFINANLDSIGHTPLLSNMCKTKNVFMGFLGHEFNVILLTGHIPINKVESLLTENNLNDYLNIVINWTKDFFPKKFSKLPIGVLGLNPHNGESALIGGFESNILNKIVNKHNKLKGPLVPDVAFLKDNWKKFSFFIALYHDQGLIPFKMIHGRTGGCHVTVGLPIVRTSVDHGTANDIFGKGCAKPDSMISAITWCEEFIKRKDKLNGI